MKITYRVRDKFEKVTQENSDDFSKDILRLEESDFEKITLDFDGVERMSSMGIGSIFSLAMGLKRRGADLVVVNVSPLLKRLFDVSGLNKYIDDREGERDEKE